MVSTPPKIGDVIFTHWPGFMSRLTMKVTGGLAAHQEQICKDAPDAETIAASADLNRMNIWTWDSRKAYFKRTKTEWCRYTPSTPLTPEQRLVLVDYFEEAKNGFRYSRPELLLQGLDSLKNWIFRIPYDSKKAVFFRRLGNVSEASVICSKVANLGLVRVGLLPARAEYWSPSDTLNKCRSSTSWVLAEATEGFFPRKPEKPAKEDCPRALDPRVVEVLANNGIRTA